MAWSCFAHDFTWWAHQRSMLVVTQYLQRALRDLTQRNLWKASTFCQKNFAKTHHDYGPALGLRDPLREGPDCLFFHPVVVSLGKILLGECGCLPRVSLHQVSQDSLPILSHHQCGPADEPTTLTSGSNNFRPAGAWPMYWRQESQFLASYLNEQWLWSPEIVTLV